jgi:hypothetical protein
MFSSPNACLIIATVPVAFVRDVHKIWSIFPVTLSDPSRNRIRSDKQLQIKWCKKAEHPAICVKFWTLTPQDTIILSSTVSSHYCNCCIDRSISPGNYGYLVYCCSVLVIFCVSGRYNWSQSPRGLRRELSSPNQTLGSWVWIPFEASSTCSYHGPRSPTDCV